MRFAAKPEFQSNFLRHGREYVLVGSTAASLLQTVLINYSGIQPLLLCALFALHLVKNDMARLMYFLTVALGLKSRQHYSNASDGW